MRPKINIEIMDVPALPAVNNNTPIKEMFKPLIIKKKPTGIAADPTKKTKSAYYKQLYQFASNFVTEEADAISKMDDLTKQVKSALDADESSSPSITLRDINKVNLDNAVASGFINKTQSKGSKAKDIVYVMDAVDQIIRGINTNVNRANKILFDQHPKGTELEDINGLQSLLDIGRLSIDRLHNSVTVKTISFDSFAELAKTKSWSSAYGADPTAFKFTNYQSFKNIEGMESIMEQIRAGKIKHAVDIARVTKNKSVRALLFTNNLYKAVIGQGWSDIRQMMDQLSPAAIRDAFDDAKKALAPKGKSIQFVFKYKSSEKVSTDDVDATYNALYKALADKIYARAEKLGAQVIAASDPDEPTIIVNDNIVNDIFAGASLI